MKKFIIRFHIAIFVFAPFSVFGQEFSSEMDGLYRNYKNLYETNEYAAINKKIPFYPKDTTLSQFADTSRPNKDQKIQLEKFSKLKNELTAKANQINQTYVRPPELATGFIKIRNEAEKKQNSTLIDLYNGKITFGEFNQRRKEIIDDLIIKHQQLSSESKQKNQKSVNQESSGSKLSQSSGVFNSMPNNHVPIHSGDKRIIASATHSSFDKSYSINLIDESCPLPFSASYPRRAEVYNLTDGGSIQSCFAVDDSSVFIQGIKNAFTVPKNSFKTTNSSQFNTFQNSSRPMDEIPRVREKQDRLEATCNTLRKQLEERKAEQNSFANALKDASAWSYGGTSGPTAALNAREAQKMAERNEINQMQLQIINLCGSL